MSDYPDYDPNQCRPDGFIGKRVDLAEVSHPPLRTCLERPLCSMEQMLEFADTAGLMPSFYRKVLAPGHWGVWQARMLEAMFWRLQDLVSTEPVLPYAWGERFHRPADGGSVPTVVAVYVDGMMNSDFTRMGLGALRPEENPAAYLDFPRGSEWPDVATEEERLEREELEKQVTSYSQPSGISLLKDTLANRSRHAFWNPLSGFAVQEAIHAWDAHRWGAKRCQIHTLAGVGGDLLQAFERSFGPQAAANLLAGQLDQKWGPGMATPKPRI